MVLLAGCAVRSDPRPDVAALARAADLARQGCYACLLEARDLYADLQEPRLREAVRPQLFEVELLVALREQELAIDAGGALQRARMLAADDLPSMPRADAYVAIVEAIRPDARGTPVREMPPVPRPLATWVRDTLEWLDAAAELPLLNAYLRAAVECLGPAADRRAPAGDGTSRDGPPLLVYRRALCGGRVDADALAQVETLVPAFIEAALFRARTPAGTAGTREGAQVRARLVDAFERLPSSAAIAHQLGAIMSTFRDRRAAAGYYSATLALRPRHEEARLGRAVALGYLERGAEAIADLTVLIDERTHVRRDAYYWRAWNHHRRAELDLARGDIEAARAISPEPHVLTLAGIIEHDQQDFATAREDLTLAVRLNGGDCTARWYLALVELSSERWRETAGQFEGAADCYAQNAAENARQRDMMARRQDLDPEFRAGQLAGFDQAIADDRGQESAAAFNAAVNFARSGGRDEALRLFERAERDPVRREVGETLRKALAGEER